MGCDRLLMRDERMSVSGFDQVVELASRLSPQEQLKLVAQIGEKLSGVLEPAATGKPATGSATAVLQAMHAPPHLDGADVDELERAVQAGHMPARRDGIFEQGNDA
jgi:hypothetical protein